MSETKLRTRRVPIARECSCPKCGHNEWREVIRLATGEVTGFKCRECERRDNESNPTVWIGDVKHRRNTAIRLGLIDGTLPLPPPVDPETQDKLDRLARWMSSTAQRGRDRPERVRTVVEPARAGVPVDPDRYEEWKLMVIAVVNCGCCSEKLLWKLEDFGKPRYAEMDQLIAGTGYGKGRNRIICHECNVIKGKKTADQHWARAEKHMMIASYMEREATYERMAL